MIFIFNVNFFSYLVRITPIITSAPVSFILVLKRSNYNYFSLFKFFIDDPINNTSSIGFIAKFKCNIYRLYIFSS